MTHESYEEYVKHQRNRTSRQTSHGQRVTTWVSEGMLQNINEILHSYIRNTETIVCHGCRNGFEVNVLQDLNPNAKVFGTDLYGPAYKYDRTYFREMDFDIVPKEWKGYFDVVYSNSIDHSRNPVSTLLAWKSELKEKGICFVTFQFSRRPVNKVDCFSLSTRRYKSEIEDIAKRSGMEALYFSELGSINQRRGYFVDVVLREKLCPV